MQERRVVITGLGAVTPVGIGLDAYWEGLKEGCSGVGPITFFDPSRYTTRFAAEVRGFNPEEFLERKEARRMDRFVQACVDRLTNPASWGIWHDAARKGIEAEDWSQRIPLWEALLPTVAAPSKRQMKKRGRVLARR